MEQRVQQELDLIKESVLKTVPAEAIYLFGSYAYGTPNEDSDIDIYVVVPDGADDLGELQANIRMTLWRKKAHQLDLLMGYSSVFHRRKDGPTLERVIVRDGVLLYG
jgi:predicted nucleotidyltransferase